jgi:hypothetical protein
MPTGIPSPLEAWSSASLTASAAAIEFATNATALALSFCTAALSPPGERTPSASAQATTGSTTVVPFPPRVGAGSAESASETVGQRGARTQRDAVTPRVPNSQTGSHQQTRKAGQSWYRAPYRSPFDPLFWMMPGHPVDHMGDWIGVMMAAAAPNLGAASPRSVAPLLAPPFTPFAAAPFAPPQLPTWSDAAWSGSPLWVWLQMVGSAPRTGASALPWLTGSNAGDGAAASPAYRTAGGHAIAPLIRPGMAEPLAKSSAPGAWFLPLIWPWLVPSGQPR